MNFALFITMFIIKDYMDDMIQRVKYSDIGKRVMNGAFWSILGTAIAKFLVLMSGIFCAHILGKIEYGKFGMIRSTISMFIVVGFAGMGLTATKHISEYLKMDKEHVGSIYLLTKGFAFFSGIFVSVIVLLFTPYLADNILVDPSLENDLRLGALLLFVSILNGAQTGVLAGFENFRSIALNVLKGSIAEAIFMLLGAFYWGVSGAVLGYGCGFVVLYICNHLSISRIMRREGISTSLSVFRKSDLALLYRFSLPAALSSLMVTPIFWIVRSILVRYDGFDELAVYEVSDQWRVIILFIPSAVSQIVLPILSTTIEEKQKFRRILNLNMFLNGGVALILAIVVSLFSPLILKMYGDGFADYWVLIVLSLSAVFAALSSVVGLSISSRSKMWIGFLFNLLWAIITVGFSVFFVRYGLGALGVSLSLLFSYFIHTCLQLFYLNKCVL